MSIPDLTNYNLLKTKKLASIQKIDTENYAIGVKQFSEIDGTALPAQVQGVTMTEINKAIADKQTEIDTLNLFKKDLLATV